MKVQSICLSLLISIITFILGSDALDCITWKTARTYNGLPENLIKAGRYRNERLYVCRASYMDELYPGKLYERSRSCLITANGRGIRVKDFEVATGIIGLYDWFTLEEIEEHSFEGKIYVCRARIGYNGDFHPGKTRKGDFGTCSIGYGHKERVEPTYQILGCVE